MSIELKYGEIIEEYTKTLIENPDLEAEAIVTGDINSNVSWHISICKRKNKDVIKGIKIREGREVTEELANLINSKSRVIN